MARPKRKSTLDAAVVYVDGPNPDNSPCVQCGQTMWANNPERWEGQPGNHPRAWWNVMDFYCPHCHSFQNVGDDARNRYVKPSGKLLETGRTVVTVRVWPPTIFPDTESATSQPMRD